MSSKITDLDKGLSTANAAKRSHAFVHVEVVQQVAALQKHALTVSEFADHHSEDLFGAVVQFLQTVVSAQVLDFQDLVTHVRSHLHVQEVFILQVVLGAHFHVLAFVPVLARDD
jgi:hypothetical protein